MIEVLSQDTREVNLDMAEGKGWTYAAGVAEYLILDPIGRYVRARAQGRHTQRVPGTRLAGGVYVPWGPDRRGRWAGALGFGFGFECLKLVVYGADGRPIPGEGGILRALAEGEARGLAEGAARCCYTCSPGASGLCRPNCWRGWPRSMPLRRLRWPMRRSTCSASMRSLAHLTIPYSSAETVGRSRYGAVLESEIAPVLAIGTRRAPAGAGGTVRSSGRKATDAMPRHYADPRTLCYHNIVVVRILTIAGSTPC